MAAYPTFSLRQLAFVVAAAAFSCALLAWALRVGAWWWMTQALGCSVYYFPEFAWGGLVTSLMAIVALIADPRECRLRSAWMLSPFAVPLLLLAFGVVFRHTEAAAAAPDWQVQVVKWFPWLLLPLGTVLLAQFRGVSQWLLILGISMTALWLSLGAQLMSAMSVTNTWI